MSQTSVKAHERGLKNTLLWKGTKPVSAEDCYAYGQHLEDLSQEKEAVIWYEKAAKMDHIPALFQWAVLMKAGWTQGGFQVLFAHVMDYDLKHLDLISFYRLGRCFTYGWGTETDVAAGWYWFNKAREAYHLLDHVPSSLLYEMSFFDEKGSAETGMDKQKAWHYLELAHRKGCQEAVWQLWHRFSGTFREFPYKRDFTEAWSFRLGRYLRAAEINPCADYYRRLSGFYRIGFPEDSEENRLKFQGLAKEYKDKAVVKRRS